MSILSPFILQMFGDGNKLLSDESYLEGIDPTELSEYNDELIRNNTRVASLWEGSFDKSNVSSFGDRLAFSLNEEFPNINVCADNFPTNFKYSCIKKLGRIPEYFHNDRFSFYQILDGCDYIEEIENPADWLWYDWKSPKAPNNPILREKYPELYI